VSAFRVGVVAFVVGALGVVGILVTPSWFPTDAAVQATRQDELYLALMILSSFIMAIVTVFIIYSVWKFRARPGDEDRDGDPIHGDTKLEIAWTIIPTILVVGFALAAGIVLVKNEERPNNRLIVKVTGQQFAWTFTYPNGRTGHMLVLPVDKPTQFNITSKPTDVIHSFYVPEFRVKSDAVPGIITHTYATPTKIGTFKLICTELCGIGHSQMRATVQVVSQSDYQSYIDSLPEPATQGGGA
jgi:cytochrome c oxidase subunit 2